MRALLAGIALLAGCLRSTTYECNSNEQCLASGEQGACEATGYCSFADTTCPSGRRYAPLSGPFAGQCVDDDAPDPDDDGDTVPNATDNCPTIANQNQHNEDSDRFGDACDPCPPVADDNPPDGDSDGVADACDPRPAMGGDRIAVFEGFGAGVPTGWMPTGAGQWMPMGDDLASHPPTAGNDAFSALGVTTSAQTGNETASAAVTVDSIDAVTNSGVSLITNAAGQSVIICLVVKNQQGENLSLTDFNNAASMPLALVAGTPYLIDLRRDAMAYSCRAAQGTATQTVGRSFPANNMPYGTGISVFGVAARFHWFMVVSNS
jgi:hypothetical protein